MDQLKIGKFIAERRKEKKLTQLQLAEKLGITDKAISKWERGIAMPDSSIMLEVCNILEISVNELLSGEKINVEEQAKKAEDLLFEFAQNEKRLSRRLYIRSRVLYFIMVFNLFMTCAIFVVDKFWGIDFTSYIIFIALSFVVYCITGAMVLPTIYETIRFRCRHCQHEFGVPKFGKEWLSIYVTCPECGKKQKAKKIPIKELKNR